jgi:putative transposase
MHQFTVGNCFRWHDVTYEVTKQLPGGKVNLVVLSTGETTNVAEHTLVTALFAGHLRFAVTKPSGIEPEGEIERPFVTLDDCSEPQQLTARYRYWVIQPLVKMEAAKRTRQAIKERITAVESALAQGSAPIKLTYDGNNEKGIRTHLSVASIYRWLKVYEESGGDIRSLIPNWHKGGRRNYLDETVDQIVTSVIDELHLQRERHGLDDLYLEIHLRLQDVNAKEETETPMPTPSRSTIHRRLHKLDATTKLQARHGKRAAQKALSQYGQMARPNRPLERVEIDHTPVDVILVDAEDGLPLGRPTLTSVMDVATCYPLGYYLGFEPPSYLTVCEALAHAFKPKGDVCTTYGTAHEWIAYGLPRTLAVDNGREFIGSSLEDACLSLGIILQYMPKMTPYFKGSIERLFRTQNSGLFHTLDGTTFANIFERGDYRSLEVAKLTLHDIDSALHIFLLDYYAEQFHEGLQGIPARRWERFLADGFQPRLPANVEDVDILLGRMTTRTLFHYGVEIDGLRYNQSDLAYLRDQLKPGKQQVKVKYHPGDISRVFIYNPFDRQYLEAPAVDQTYTQGLSLWKHQIIRTFLKQERGRVDREGLAWAKRKMRAIVADAKVRQRQNKSRKRVARWETSGRSAQNLPAASEPVTAAPGELPPTPKTETKKTLEPALEHLAKLRLKFTAEELEAEGWRTSYLPD